jgi:hypothetical protein
MMIGTFVEVHVRTELVRTPMIHITSYTTLIQLAFYNYLRVLASFYFSVPCLFSDPLASTSRAVLVFFAQGTKRSTGEKSTMRSFRTLARTVAA